MARLPSQVSHAGTLRYFSIALRPSDHHALKVRLTTITGVAPDLLLSTEYAAQPDSSTAMVSSPGTPTSSFQYVKLSAADIARTCHATACTYFIAVRTHAPVVYSLVATLGSDPVRLVGGVPQGGSLPAGGGTASFVARPSGSHSGLVLSLATSYGSAHLAASNSAGQWSSDRLDTGSERLVISTTDAGFSAATDLVVTVQSDGPAEFTLTAASADELLLLQDGTPTTERVNAYSYAYYKFYVSQPLADVDVILTALSGDPDLYVSLTTPRPTAITPGVRSSESHSSAGEVIKLSHTDPTLAVCTRGVGPCIVYISVHGTQSDASYSLMASAFDVTDGFRIDAPSDVAGSRAFALAIFGPSLPHRALTRCLAYATPHDACSPVGANVAGKIALVDRGSTVLSGPGRCDYPDVYFANKVYRAQQAGAEAVIIMDDRPGNRLTNMIAVTADSSALVTIPCAAPLSFACRSAVRSPSRAQPFRDHRPPPHHLVTRAAPSSSPRPRAQS